MKDFSNWLLREMEKQKLSQAELARRAVVNQSTISLVISGKRRAGEDLCAALAKGLDLPPEVVFRAAGILPPDSGKPPGLEEWVYLYTTASQAEREEMLDYARYKKQRRPANGRSS